MRVKIYKPTKTAMQSGRAKTRAWVLESVPTHRKAPEAIMGWVSSKDTLSQIRLTFDSAEQAMAYAQEKGWEFTVLPEKTRTIRPKNYASNFAFKG